MYQMWISQDITKEYEMCLLKTLPEEHVLLPPGYVYAEYTCHYF